MDKVLVTKQGFVAVDSDGGKSQFGLSDLRRGVEIEEGVTLRDIFDAVDANNELRYFISNYSWCSKIAEFHLAAREPKQPTASDETELVALEVLMRVDIHELSNDKHMNVFGEFLGVGADGTSYSVSFSPMSSIADLPIRINENAFFSRYGKETLDRERINMSPSFLEFLDAIYYDISFYGGPEEAKEMRDSLVTMVKEIEDGTATTVPLEDVLKELRAEDNNTEVN